MAAKRRRLPQPLDEDPPDPQLQPTSEILSAYMETIVKAIALTNSIMLRSAEDEQTEIEDDCHNWMGMVGMMIKESGLSDKYQWAAVTEAQLRAGVISAAEQLGYLAYHPTISQFSKPGFPRLNHRRAWSDLDVRVQGKQRHGVEIPAAMDRSTPR